MNCSKCETPISDKKVSGLCKTCYDYTWWHKRFYAEDSSEFRKRRTESQRWSHTKARYGISKEQYLEMLEAQGGVCLICNSPEKGSRRLAIDHCHTTGKVRGLLCTACNNNLGTYEKMKDKFEFYLGRN